MRLDAREGRLLVLMGVLALAFGAYFAACEVWGAYEYLIRDQGSWNYIVASGVGIAGVLALLPAWASFAWRSRKSLSIGLWVSFAGAILVVFATALARTGSATDQAQVNRQNAQEAREIARNVELEEKANLAAAMKVYTRECNDVRGKTAIGEACRAAVADRDRAQKRLDEARAVLMREVGSPGDGLARRIASLLQIGWNVTEDQVRTWQPMVVPLVTSLLSALCMAFGVWSVSEALAALRAWWSKPAQSAPRDIPVEKPATPKIVAAKAQQRPAPLRPKVGRVIEFIVDATEAAQGERVSALDLLPAYRTWCAKRGLEPISAAQFGDELLTISQKAGLALREEAGQFYVADVRLCA